MSDALSAGRPSTPAGGNVPSDQASAASMRLTRTGGIAGVNDVLEIDDDGSARLTRSTGQVITCSPMPETVARLRATDLKAVGTARSKAPMADGFSYTLVTALGTATAGDGEQGIRAEFVSTAAEVMASCQATATGGRSASSNPTEQA